MNKIAVDFDALGKEMGNISEFIKELQKESDRGLVLVSVAYLDEIIGDILKTFFVDTRESEELLKRGMRSPLGSFDPRMNLCFALGLIDPLEYKILRVLKVLRNSGAAHRWKRFDLKDRKFGRLIRQLPVVTDAAEGIKENLILVITQLIIKLISHGAELGREKRQARISEEFVNWTEDKPF
jgi:DNA-binding MltR family transcriptional regulator